MIRYDFLLIFTFLFTITVPLQAQFKNKREKAELSIENATDAFESLANMEEGESIPQALIAKAEGIVIFPEALKVAIGVGGQGGRGLALVRLEDGSWSNPYFVGMGEGNIGAQIGVQSADIVLLFRNKKNVMSLEKGDLALGGDVGIAAGPVGRNSSVSTDVGFDAEIYSYSKSKGLYAGISLEGTVLKANKKLNEEYYGREGKNMESVFRATNPYNENVSSLQQAIKKASL